MSFSVEELFEKQPRFLGLFFFFFRQFSCGDASGDTYADT